MSSTPATHTVACCVRDQAAYAHIARAAASAGYQIQRLGQDAVQTAAGSIAALVYDLSPTRSEDAGEVVLRWRREHPSCPILLYYPPGSQTARLAGRMSSLPGVGARVQRPTSPGEGAELAAFVREFLTGRPELRVRVLLADMWPDASTHLTVLVDSLLNRLGRGELGAPKVTALAASAGSSAPAMRRACRLAGLPTPARLVRWISLIYITVLAEDQRLSVAAAARRAGVSESYVRKLRRALIPTVERLTTSALPLAIARFVAQCGRSELSTRVPRRRPRPDRGT